MLLFLFAFKSTTNVKSSHQAVFLTNFGFEANAKFEISLTQTVHQYCFTFIHDSQYKEMRTSVIEDKVTCSNINETKYFHFLNNLSPTYNGTIDTKGIYYPLIVNTDDSNNRVETQITEIYRNPASYLDYRWGGIVEGKIGVLVILFVILVAWLVNWFLHFHVQIWLHYCLTAVFISNLIYQTFRLFELRSLTFVDDILWLTVFRVILSLISEIIFYATILLCAKGWCVVRDSVSIKEIILCIVYSTLFMLFRILSQYILSGTWAVVILVFALISIVLFLRELMVSINNANLLIYAHLLAITNAGYDSKTTPVYQKHLMYRNFQFIFLGDCVMILIYLIILIFVDLPYTAQEMIEDCIEVIVLIALEILFKLRGGKLTNYTLIREQSDADEVSLADLESININSPILNRGGRAWSEEMPLPALPTIVPKRRIDPETLSGGREMTDAQSQQSDVILASPDGTDTLHARLITDGSNQQEEI